MRFKRGAVIVFRVTLSETKIIVYEVYLGSWYMKVIYMKCRVKRGLKCVIRQVSNATNAVTRFESCRPEFFSPSSLAALKKDK